MTPDPLSPTEAHETLDHKQLLAASHGPGHYALRLTVPDTVAAARERWDAHHDARPPEPTLERLAAAPDVAYVGASADVYERIMDHARGDVRQTAVMGPFPPSGILDVWPCEEPFASEWRRARTLANELPYAVWVDGELLE